MERGFSITAESPDQPEVAALFAASDAYAAALYTAESNHLVTHNVFSASGAAFFVVRGDGRALGCGGVVPLADGVAEIKRMFVAPEARGRRLGRALLETLEAAARERGVTVLRLETGISQPEALRLYASLGYRRRPPFGAYTDDPLSVFMEKRL
jgi:putative acetyltransferase